MSFVIALVLGIVVFLMITSDSANAHNKLTAYKSTHPPKKHQEEFLKVCELYLEYSQNPKKYPNPAQDAKADAAIFIKDQGFLPAALESTEIYSSPQDYLPMLYSERSPVYMSFYAIENCLLRAFIEAQDRDQWPSGFVSDKQFYRNITHEFQTEAWDRYCYSMDCEFNKMVDRYEEVFKRERFKDFGPKINQNDRSYQYYFKKDTN